MVNMELGEDLIKQLEVTSSTNLINEDSTNQVKFDAKGTLHIMNHDSNGKLLKDIPVKEIKNTTSYIDELRAEYLSKSLRTNSNNKLLYVLLAIMGILTIMSMHIINLLT